MKIPTREEFQSIIAEAEKARAKAAKEAYDKLPPFVQQFPDMAGACGGARLILSVDGRSEMGKFFKSLIEDPIPNLQVWKTRIGFQLFVGQPLGYQHEYVCNEAEQAALRVIESKLKVEGYVDSYLS
ncbi:MAG: hypothetical protein A2V66_12185 [Ignavibacteria bacterium RBG_13_36_8]|nr:MAG: hypothetical protein A2V66_12185 [Ignavibacteria bacterium RBG_13_36_8]